MTIMFPGTTAYMMHEMNMKISPTYQLQNYDPWAPTPTYEPPKFYEPISEYVNPVSFNNYDNNFTYEEPVKPDYEYHWTEIIKDKY